MRVALAALVLAIATPAVAGPTNASVVTADIDDAVIAELAQLHDQSSEEPGGIVVPKDVSANIQRAGLKGGDIVLRVNGDRVGQTISMGWGTTLVEVDRHGQLVILHLIHPNPKVTTSLEDDDRVEAVALIRTVAIGVTKSGKPSGVRLGEAVRDFFAAGDIVRTIDGTPITTPEELATHLASGGDTTTIKLDRDDRTLTIQIQRVHSIDLTGVVKVSDTSYQVPQAIADGFLANPDTLSKGARVVPSMKNGQQDGWKLYAIRPSSALAKLGFTNGDTIIRINGMDLGSADKAVEVLTKLRSAKKLTVDIVRRGNALTLTYTITTGTK